MATLLSIAARRDGTNPVARHEDDSASAPPADDRPVDEVDDPQYGLDELSRWYYRRWQPATGEERHLVDVLILAEWQLRRLQADRQRIPRETA